MDKMGGHSGSLPPLISRSCVLSVLSYTYSNKKLDILVVHLYPNAEKVSYYTTWQSFTLSVDTLKFIGKNIYRTSQFQANIIEYAQNTDFLYPFIQQT